MTPCQDFSVGDDRHRVGDSGCHFHHASLPRKAFDRHWGTAIGGRSISELARDIAAPGQDLATSPGASEWR